MNYRKKVKTMNKTYDPNKDYMEEMKRYAAVGDEGGFKSSQAARNAKINDNGLGYATTNYTMADFAKQNGIGAPAVKPIITTPTPIKTNTAAIPGVKVHSNAPAMIGNYDFDTDFQAQINDALARGDYGAAAMYENLRNQKLGFMDSPYSTTYRFNYNDPYRGQLERIQDDIINREEFSYDYRDDDQYKAIKKLKEKEAQKAYDDGYGAMSRQFEGDVPVAMINKLLDTKADIIDQADSYIPQLRQLAQQMYMNEGDQMMRNYSMIRDEAEHDYNRWAVDRNMAIAGADNAYNRAYGERAYADDVTYRDKVFERGAFTEDRSWDYGVEQDALDRELEKQRTERGISEANNERIVETAKTIISLNPGMSYETAMKKAKELVSSNEMLLK